MTLFILVHFYIMINKVSGLFYMLETTLSCTTKKRGRFIEFYSIQVFDA